MALIILFPEVAANFASLGFDQANVVYAGLKPEHRRQLVWQSALVAIVIGGLAAVGCMTFLVAEAPGFRSFLQAPLWLYLLVLSTVPCRLVAAYWGEIVRGMNRIFIVNLLDVGMKGFSVILLVTLVGWLRLDVAGAVWVDFSGNVAKTALLFFVLMRLGLWGMPCFDWAVWKRTTRFAFPSYCST